MLVKSGNLDNISVAPTQKTTVNIPVGALDAGAEYAVTLRYKLPEKTLWADAGHEVAAEQFVLQQATSAATLLSKAIVTARRGTVVLETKETRKASAQVSAAASAVIEVARSAPSHGPESDSKTTRPPNAPGEESLPFW